jgi:hypothetical protein
MYALYHMNGNRVQQPHGIWKNYEVREFNLQHNNILFQDLNQWHYTIKHVNYK